MRGRRDGVLTPGLDPTPRFVLYALSPAGCEASARLCPYARPIPGPGLSQPKGDHMPLYECVFIARNDITQQQVEAIADQVAATLAEGGGEVRKREYWGLRGLAYRIKKNRKGHYMLLGLDTPPAALNEAERQLGLNEDVLRMLTVRVEAIDEAPSVVMSKRGGGEDRDREKSFRGPRPAGRFGSGRGGRGDDREAFRARGRDEMDMPMGLED